MAQNIMELLQEYNEIAVQQRMDRRIERIRKEVQEQVRKRTGFYREIAPTLEKYRESKELFTTYKLGRAIYGRDYLRESNGNASILPAKIGYALRELADMGIIEEVADLCNPSCPYMYQFV